MFTFSSPHFFFLLIPTGIATWFVYRRRIRAAALFAPVSRIPATTVSWRARLSAILPLFFLLGLALAVAALARPQTVLSTTRHSTDAIAIEMVTDISGSMEALDMSEIVGNRIIRERTRLDVVKQTFAEFIKERPDDLIGLIAFGGYASTRAPLTADHNALLHSLKGIQVPSAATDAKGNMLNQEELLTAIGDGLATACARLEHVDVKSKIIVLLSDGKSNTGVIKPEAAMKAAKDLGVKVYTIGVGKSGRAPFRQRDIFGREVIQFAMVEMDEDLLKKIADTTDGEYFNVKNPKGMEQALATIDKLEKTEIERDIYNQYNELFLWLLAPGLGLVVLGATLNMTILKKII